MTSARSTSAQTKDELEIELGGWLDRLRAKIREVGDMELKLKALAEDASRDEFTEQLVALRTEETALVERSRIILAAQKAKGGDVQNAEQFINAVSAIGETTDATSRWAALIAVATNWIERDDGGKFWAKRLLLAVVILLIFWMISKVAGRLTASALSRKPQASTLLENFARRTSGGVVFVPAAQASLIQRKSS
jgi:hypothetical protein